MVTSKLSLFILLGVGLHALAIPLLEERASVTALSAATVASYQPYTWYASTAYCTPKATLNWSCGNNCNKNPTFKPIASGGDGSLTQYWYVGYDGTLKTIIVAFQGTDAAKLVPLLTSANLDFKPLDAILFPGVSSSIKTHDGFGDAQKRSASAVLAAVKKGLIQHSTKEVTVVGHSLGGAIAVISTGHLSLNLPSDTVLKTITYGMPRVGNAAFVSWINSRAEMVRINNKDDIVPIIPGRFLGYSHTEGEIHITNSNSWVSCPGTDNEDSQCTIGYVPNILAGNLNDHSGPFDGISLGC